MKFLFAIKLSANCEQGAKYLQIVRKLYVN
jgi:hypothetical protein